MGFLEMQGYIPWGNEDEAVKASVYFDLLLDLEHLPQEIN
jgi:hypothetical protein